MKDTENITHLIVSIHFQLPSGNDLFYFGKKFTFFFLFCFQKDFEGRVIMLLCKLNGTGAAKNTLENEQMQVH